MVKRNILREQWLLLSVYPGLHFICILSSAWIKFYWFRPGPLLVEHYMSLLN